MFGYLRRSGACYLRVNHLAALPDPLAERNIEFLWLSLDSRHDQPSMLQARPDRHA